MTAAERRADLLEQAAKSDNLSAALLGEILRELVDHGVPANRAPAQPSTGGTLSGAFKFGRQKGAAFEDGSDENLAWYRGALQQSLDDPAKEKYRSYNLADIATIDRVIASRSGGGQPPSTGAGDPPPDFGPPSDDDLPFATCEGRR